MYILGINGGVRLGYQDASAVLMQDGKLIAAIEEERISRIKHGPGMLSFQSINEVLKIADISIKDVDIVATHGSTWGEHFGEVLKDYFKVTYKHEPEFQRYHHHDCHAASTYYASGYDEAMIVTVDASGDGTSTQLSVGRNEKMELVERFSRPNSLGIFYAMITQFCGFTRDTDEYKLMGLAPYGNPKAYDLGFLLRIIGDSYIVKEEYLKDIKPGDPQPSRQEALFNSELGIELRLSPRKKGDELTQDYKDLAASAQYYLEVALIHLVTQFHKRTGLRKLCLAGGVALNCSANRKLMNLDFIDEIYVQPASSDAGISLGAAYMAAAENGFVIEPMDSVYLGTAFSNDAIKTVLDDCGVVYEEVDNPSETAAALVAQNKVVGWFQGRSEFGPRALGNRSILANPGTAEMKDIINHKIKFREGYRPFCPSVLEEKAADYFEGDQMIAPFMTINYDVINADPIPAGTHVDNTARIQTVNEQQNPLYYNYLKALERLTGTPVSLNTSFNRNSEPIVNHPREAVSAYFGSGMDALVIGNFLLQKKA